MYCLTVVDGKHRGKEIELNRFPFVVGKNREAQLCLSDAGVWEDHLAIELRAGEGPSVRRMGDGLVDVNSEPVERTKLRNGDVITLGAAQLRFGAAPVKRRSLVIHNAVSWLAIACVLVVELFLIFLLKRG